MEGQDWNQVWSKLEVAEMRVGGSFDAGEVLGLGMNIYDQTEVQESIYSVL
jgi:hypothetical protein